MRIAGPRGCAGLAFAGLAIGLVAAIAAEPKAKQPPSPYAALVAEIVPDDAPARPPFQPGRYDLGIRWREKSQPSATALTLHAAARQERLQRLWNQLRNEHSATGVEQRAEERLLSYAMGESALDGALQAAQEAGPAAQFRLARLLLAECRFDEAVQLLATVIVQDTKVAGTLRVPSAPWPEQQVPVRGLGRPADGTRSVPVTLLALTLLARHDAERSVLASHLPLAPLAFDLPGFLKRQGNDPARRSLIAAARQTTVVRLPEALKAERIDIGEPEPPEELDVDPTLDRDFNQPTNMGDDNPWYKGDLCDVQRLYLATGGGEFALFHEADQPLDNRHARFTLNSEFNGPVCLRLYRFPARADWQGVDAASLAGWKPQRTWTHEYQPLTQNNQGGKSWPVDVENPGPGYYLLTAEARCCPVLAGCKFCLSNVTVYLRAGPNRVAAVAVDRQTGKPVAGLPLELHLSGRPDERLLIERFRPGDEKAFLQGFHGAKAEILYDHGPIASEKKTGKPIAPRPADNERDPLVDGTAAGKEEASGSDNPFAESPSPDRLGGSTGSTNVQAVDQVLTPLPQAVVTAESYVQGVAARRSWPDRQQDIALRTGNDGQAATDQDLGQRGYNYELDLRRNAAADIGQPSHVALSYRQSEPNSSAWRRIVWLDQPVHRPGDTVRFSGLVRQIDNAHVADHDVRRPATPRQVEVLVRDRNLGKLWQGSCPLSAAGTFQGSFRLPPNAGSGPCHFTVDGCSTLPNPPLVIDEFRLNTFAVRLVVPERNPAAGEPVEGDVRVEYFTGKPAVGAEAEVVAELDGAEALRTIGTTDSRGVLHFRLPLPPLESPQWVVLRAVATDVSGQSFAAVDQMLVRAAPFRVEAEADCDAVSPGAVVKLAVRATRWNDRPVAGATVTAFGIGQAAVTDRDGCARLSWKCGQKSESVQITVLAGGTAAHSECKIAVRPQSPDRAPSPDPEGTALRIRAWSVPPRAEAGDVLHCRLKFDGWKGRSATVAVFMENDRLLASRVFALPPGEHTLEIPTENSFVPYVKLVAVVIDGERTETATASAFLHPAEKLLKLQIETDKAEYRPGDRCSAVITARDHRGRAVPRAAISLGVVDEAVYQTREDPLPDLFALLYEYEIADRCSGRQEEIDPCAEAVQFLRGPRYAWGYYANPLGFGQGHRGCLHGCGGGTTHCERWPGIALRRRFETAAHWVADVFTDADGAARVSFKLPDNVTQWRFTARGVTADTLVGSIVVARRTFLSLNVELALPRGFREGDRIDLPVVVHNNTNDARQVQGTTQFGGQDENLPSPFGRGAGGEGGFQRLWPEHVLPPGGDFAFTVPVTAADCRPIELLATVRAGDGAADAVRRQIVPMPRIPPATRQWSGALNLATVRRVCNLRAQQGTALSVTVRRESGLAGPVQSALNGLVQYPYGCVEQTMSRFMPAVVAGAAMEEAHLDNPAGERLPEVIGQGLQRLVDFQHRDGGWGWWKFDETNDFMTAYVIEGLARCRRLKQPLPYSVLERGSAYLLRQVEQGRLHGHRPESIGAVDLEVYAVHALAECVEADETFKKENGAALEAAARRIAQRHSPDQPSVGARRGAGGEGRFGENSGSLDRVLLADAWRLLGERTEAFRGLMQVASRAAPRAGDRQLIIAAAAILELGAALQPQDPRWQGLARQIVNERQDCGWGDTLTTSAAVRGLSAMLAARPAKETPVAVFLDGRKIGDLSADHGNRIQVQADSVGAVVFQPSAGRCRDFYAIEVQGCFNQPHRPPSDPKVVVRTRIFATEPSRQEVLPDAGGRLSIVRGQTYQLRLEVDLKQEVSHARLTLPRPCGVELVRLPPRNDGLVSIDARDDAVHFFIDRWEAGRHSIVFPIRAEVSGDVLSPRPELVPMYGDSLPTAVIAPRQIVVGTAAK
jgi:hypothetical protein